MKLVWTKKSDAEASLAAINELLGCPIKGRQGYIMETWDAP